MVSKTSLLSFIAALLIYASGFAATAPAFKGNISGTVTDAYGKALSGVSIFIPDARRGVTTDGQGKYVISNLSGGIHLIEFSSVGYSSKVISVDVTNDVIKDIVLNVSVTENDAVILTATSRASQLRKIPYTVEVLRARDLQQTAASNIVEAITRKPGISMISTGPAISKPIIRGLGYNRVLTLNDGVRQEGQQWGDEHGLEIDQASVNKIEVLKGPASLIYGSDAMAGVVNVITNVPVAENTILANVSSQFQTNSRLRSGYASIAGNINGISWNAYGSLRAAADYKNKYDGYVLNSKFREQNFGGYIGYNGSFGYSHLLVSNFNLRPGLVEGERDNEGNFIKPVAGGGETEATEADFKTTVALIPYQHIRHFKIASDNSFNIGGAKLALNAGFQRNQREEFGNADDPEEQELYFDLKTYTVTGRLHFKERRGWRSSAGVSIMRQTNANRGAEQLIPDYVLTDAGGYFFTEKEIKKFNFSGGLRYDTREMNADALIDENGDAKGTPFVKNFDNVSGSAGFTYRATDALNFKFNLARAFRAPSIPELASNGAHEGTTRYEYGDANLKSETSTHSELAAEYNNEHISASLAGYITGFNNFIFYSKLQTPGGADSLVDADGELLNAFRFEQRRANFAGIEASLDVHPHAIHWLHFQNSFSYVSGRLRDELEGTRNLPAVPAPRLLTELRADFQKAGKQFSGLYAKVELDNNFRQSRAFTAFDTETPTAGYTLLNAGFGADVLNKKSKTIFTLNFSANNLGDVAYQNHLSRLKYAAVNDATGRRGVFNQGRNFSIRLNIPLVFHSNRGKV